MYKSPFFIDFIKIQIIIFVGKNVSIIIYIVLKNNNLTI